MPSRSEKAKPNLLSYTVCVSTPICAALDWPKKGLALFFAARNEVAPTKFPAGSFSALYSARTMAPASTKFHLFSENVDGDLFDLWRSDSQLENDVRAVFWELEFSVISNVGLIELCKAAQGSLANSVPFRLWRGCLSWKLLMSIYLLS